LRICANSAQMRPDATAPGWQRGRHANKTTKDVARVMRWWRDTYGRRTLAKVSTPWLTQIRDELASGTYLVGPTHKRTERQRKPGTVNRHVTYLRVVLSYGVEIGWMTRSPLMKKLAEPQRVRFLSDNELRALTKALEACQERCMLPSSTARCRLVRALVNSWASNGRT
jgi:hypothetical protein